jgi:predicted TIM-barrel fold metal-dependent hydrolase
MLIEANPDRILWGTDWPHPAPPIARKDSSEPMPLFPMDDGRLLNLLPMWAPDPAIRKKILVDNPAHLFRF